MTSVTGLSRRHASST